MLILDLLGWIRDVASLDIETMTPVKRWLTVIVFTLIGMLLFGVGLLPLIYWKPDNGLGIAAGLLTSAAGLGFIARVGFGLAAVHRRKREAK